MSSPRRSDSPVKRRSDSPVGRRSSTPRKSNDLSRFDRFIKNPEQADYVKFKQLYDELTPTLKRDPKAERVKAILDTVEEAQQLRRDLGENPEYIDPTQLDSANRLLGSGILFDQDLKEYLEWIAQANEETALELMARVERALSKDQTEEEKRKLLALLDQASEVADEEEQGRIEELRGLIDIRPRGPVLDVYSEAFSKEAKKLLTELQSQKDLTPSQRQIFQKRLKQIKDQIDQYKNSYAFEPRQIRFLDSIWQNIQEKINQKPAPAAKPTYRRPKVSVPLLDKEDLATLDLDSLLNDYQNRWYNPQSSQVEKENIITNLKFIAKSARDDYTFDQVNVFLKDIGATISEDVDLQLLRDVIDSEDLEWPEREAIPINNSQEMQENNREFLEIVQSNFRVIEENVPFFKQAVQRAEANTTNPQTSSCLSTKQLDLHQLFSIAWFYCPSSTGVFNFFSTGGGKTATAWATLRMYRDQHKYGSPDSVKLIWVSFRHLFEDAWKDSWAYSDIMFGYEPGKGTPAQERERKQIEKEVWFVTYIEFSNFTTGGFKTYADQTQERYGFRPPNNRLRPEDLKNAKIIIDEAQYMVEESSDPRTKGVNYDDIMNYFSQAYEVLPEGKPKLSVLTATPSVNNIEATPKLLNLLIWDSRLRLPDTSDGLQPYFEQGQWTPDGKILWDTLTRGLTVCYDGHGDKSLFAQKHVNPMIVVRGNVGQQKALKECRNKNKITEAKCKREKLDYFNLSKGELQPTGVDPTRNWNQEKATKALFEPQPK